MSLSLENATAASQPKRQREDGADSDQDITQDACERQNVVKRRRLVIENQDETADIAEEQSNLNEEEDQENQSDQPDRPDTPQVSKDSDSDDDDDDDCSESTQSTITIAPSPATAKIPLDFATEITHTLQFVCVITLFTFVIAAIGVMFCPAAPKAYLEYVSDLDFFEISGYVRPRAFQTLHCYMPTKPLDNLAILSSSSVDRSFAGFRFIPNGFYFADPLFV